MGNAGNSTPPPPFPAHWGDPPAVQNDDLCSLPAGYGAGSSTLAAWIQDHLETDAEPAAAGMSASEVQMAALAAEMPSLADQPLIAPRFHPVDWREGQLFTANNDPDRTSQPWAPPAFIGTDPAARPLPVCQELAVTGSGPGRFARVVRGVLSPAECAALLEAVNSKGFSPALLNIGGGRQILDRTARDGNRVIVDSRPAADWLLGRLTPFLPERMDGCWRLAGLNERLRVLCYVPGQQFPVHRDGAYMRPDGDCSKVTIQIYLNDVPAEFGGATRFIDEGRPGEDLGHQPEAGSVLIFTQNLLHEGSRVHQGIKYTVRTEAMYRYEKRPRTDGRSSNSFCSVDEEFETNLC